MDYTREYQSAVDLASELRYEEAREKLKGILSEHPDKTKALILLGKVEYYLHLFKSSRRCFETVLTLDPGNFDAYYGLQFFTERKRRIRTLTAWISSIFMLLLLGFTFYLTVITVNQKLVERLVKIERQLETQHNAQAEILKQTGIVSDKMERSTQDISAELADLEQKQEERHRELEDKLTYRYRTILNILDDLLTAMPEEESPKSELIP